MLDYDEFYHTKPLDQVFASMRDELAEDGAVMFRPQEHDTLRYVRNPGPELRPNTMTLGRRKHARHQQRSRQSVCEKAVPGGLEPVTRKQTIRALDLGP